MPLRCLGLCCQSGGGALVLVVALTLLVVPIRFFIPEAFSSSQELENVNGLVNLDNLEVASPEDTFTDHFHRQELDLFSSIIVLGVGLTVYLYEWIHRKLMERRILKVRALLGASLERLRETEVRREKLEGTLKLARDAAAEYNLLLYLLLRKRPDLADFNQENFA